MSRQAGISEFNMSDGFTPLQISKLNSNFKSIMDLIRSGVSGSSGTVDGMQTVQVESTITLEPGEDAYVLDAGYPPFVKLRFGIPRGDKGDKGSKGDKGDKGDTGDSSNIIHIGSSAPSPRGEKVLWYDTRDGSLNVWKLDTSTTPSRWSWVTL